MEVVLLAVTRPLTFNETPPPEEIRARGSRRLGPVSSQVMEVEITPVKAFALALGLAPAGAKCRRSAAVSFRKL
jgi:hypothetical protein